MTHTTIDDSTLVVAVSGGVDSVVLLDMLAKRSRARLVVAHFDHGIRGNSSQDEAFVRRLAEDVYRLPYQTRREQLGAGASEDLARQRRYRFLRKVAARYDAQIVTAHHGDDTVETVALNLQRGTGWRGLAVLNAPGVLRPLLGFTKQQLLGYAKRHELEWREDASNLSEDYARNRMRHTLKALDAHSQQAVKELASRQRHLAAAIDHEIERLLPHVDRHFLTNIDQGVAVELLRAWCCTVHELPLTRPDAERLLLAVKTARSNARVDITRGATLAFQGRQLIVERPRQVVR